MTEKRSLYDVTIICTTDDYQAAYWMERLGSGICAKDEGAISGSFPIVLGVSEDWAKGGAGNGLGTLYAYQKACRLAEERYGVDVASLLGKGEISAALYHTAGKGTRLAPLPASENNNKPAVKLPICHMVNGVSAPMTVLEAVIRQTGVYAHSRKGRLSVYWGDQVFIPSAAFEYSPSHHVDILCALGETAPTPEEWKERGLDKYGVIAVMPSGESAQVEKVDHATAVSMLSSLGEIKRVGPSLGSFSVSSAILEALCEEYKEELHAKEGKLDTDPHFWMPLTLPEAEYAKLMSDKGEDKDKCIKHHKRMSKMKASFLDSNSGDMGMFGAVDVGDNACWWDYGQVKLYSTNNLKLIDTDKNSDLLRKFLGVKTKQSSDSNIGVEAAICPKSSIASCNIKSGSITDSVLCCVNCPDVTATGAIIVNCTAKKIFAPKGSIIYNVIDESDDGIVVGEGDVRVSVMSADGSSMILNSNMSVDGKEAWKKVLDGNTDSFEGVHAKNFNADVATIDRKRKFAYDQTSKKLI